MATKQDVIDEAARRLGDESTAFKTLIGNAFNWVMRDLALADALAPLRKAALFTIFPNNREYDTKIITGESVYPSRITDIIVWDWGHPYGFVRQAKISKEYDEIRMLHGDWWRGRWQIWQTHPDYRTLVVWPPASSEEDGDTAEVRYEAAVDSLSDGDEIQQVHDDGIETLVYGIMFRMAQFKEETIPDAQMWGALYENGKRQLWGRRHNDRMGVIQPQDQ